MERKKAIRTQIRKQRLQVPKEEWIENSNSICEKAYYHPILQNATKIFAYVDVRGEVETKGLIAKLLENGKVVAVPKIIGEKMIFIPIHSLKELHKGAYGILEPDGTEIVPDANTCMLVPGVAFDEKGHRLGQGKGYYDKYLSAYPEVKTIGLAFTYQVLENIPFESHDISMQILITEDKIYE